MHSKNYFSVNCHSMKYRKEVDILYFLEIDVQLLYFIVHFSCLF